jgi:polyhydroxyalkanoate synthesis regulator phasin
MTERAPDTEVKADAQEAAPTPPPPRRGPGHRGQDMRDTVAEMAAKAHEISLEAGSKMAAAMKDVVGAAAGLTAFAIESARDLVQYMVRRGQMTQEEADKLIREAEEANAKRPKSNLPPPRSADPKKTPGSVHPATPAKPPAAPAAAAKPAPAVVTAPKAPAPVAAKPAPVPVKAAPVAVVKAAPAAKPPVKAAEPAAKTAVAKSVAAKKPAAKSVPAKPVAKKPVAKNHKRK